MDESFVITDKLEYGDNIYRVRGKSDSDNGLTYIAKVFSEHESEVSNTICKEAPKTIIVPFFKTEMINGKKFMINLEQHAGLFVSEIIKRLRNSDIQERDRISFVISIIRSILVTLNAFHSYRDDDQGYLHLDIHPGNIWMENASFDVKQRSFDSGTAKFIDFSNSVNTNDIAGELKKLDSIGITYGYSSPELSKRQFYAIGSWSDLYSATAIFVSLISKERLIELDRNISRSALYQLKKSFHNPILGEAVASFVEIGLNPNPDYRFETIETMQSYIDALKECNESFYEHRFYDLFACAYRLRIKPESINFASIYKEFDEKSFSKAVEKLSEHLLQERIQINREYYVFSSLWKLMEIYKGTGNIAGRLYETDAKLVNCGIACTNHTSNRELFFDSLLVRAEEFRKDSYNSFSPQINNRLAIAYQDIYEYDKAKELLQENINDLEQRKQISPYVASSLDLGRAYSAYAANCVLLGEGEDPMPFFKKAIEEFRSNNSSGNVRITTAHILNYAIEINDEVLFREYAETYFDGVSGNDGFLDYKIKTGRFDAYKWLLYLKGVYSFYLVPQKIDDADLYVFLDRLNTIRRSPELLRLDEHPAELIWKYITLCFFKGGDNYKMQSGNSLNKCLNSVKQCIIDPKSELTIEMCITYQNIAIYNDLTGHESENVALLESFKEHFNNGKQRMKEGLLIRAETYGLSRLLTYEYT